MQPEAQQSNTQTSNTFSIGGHAATIEQTNTGNGGVRLTIRWIDHNVPQSVYDATLKAVNGWCEGMIQKQCSANAHRDGNQLVIQAFSPAGVPGPKVISQGIETLLTTLRGVTLSQAAGIEGGSREEVPA